MQNRKSLFRSVCPVFCGIVVLLNCVTTSESGQPEANRLARPVQLLLTDDDQFLLVCNQRSGSIDVVETKSHNVVSRHKVGKSLSSFAWISGTKLAVADRQEHVVRILELENSSRPSLQQVAQIRVSHSPVNVITSNDRNRVFVASLWSHRWSSIDVTKAKPSIDKVVDLPFAPSHQFQLDNLNTIVTGAFGGNWLVLNHQTGRIVKRGEFEGTHSIAGIAKSQDGSKLFIPHMTLSHEKPTTKFNVHWGDVMLNVVRSVPINDLVLSDGSPSDNFSFLGYPDRATGDPSGIIVTKDGRQIICFAGVNEVGISDVGVNAFERITVGRRPIAMALTADESTLYVANQQDDSIAVIEVNAKKLSKTIVLSNAKLSEVEIGEQLFYDSRLSSDGWFSCHSCHTDGHTNGGMADTFGDGKPGDAKRVLSLLGTSETGPWAWNGKTESTAQQVHKSIVTTMRGPRPSAEQVKAIDAYISTLRPAPSVSVARGTIDSDKIKKGKRLFASQGCSDCHAGPTYTSAEAFDVGLEDQLGNREFNPPSLRGVSQRTRLFHDNRAGSVRDVLTRFSHPSTDGQADSNLDESELDALIEFVLSL